MVDESVWGEVLLPPWTMMMMHRRKKIAGVDGWGWGYGWGWVMT